jgi:hypothetical protein
MQQSAVGRLGVWPLSRCGWFTARWDWLRQIRGQEARDEHAGFMDGLAGDGIVILGGPAGDGGQTLHLTRAADEHEIKGSHYR